MQCLIPSSTGSKPKVAEFPKNVLTKNKLLNHAGVLYR